MTDAPIRIVGASVTAELPVVVAELAPIADRLVLARGHRGAAGQPSAVA